MNIKRYIINNYNIGLSLLSIILFKFGLLYNKSYKNINNKGLLKQLEKNLLYFFKRKEQIKHIRYNNIMKKIVNGSYFGYKRIRGLPMYNQRSKTNNRSSRKKII